ncbi:hypothetical protein Vi05172_g12994 [Venturia inaequalis]|nr:hypothetical protein Vi05172_g12994 [Venturia inaequalis]
MPVRGTVRINNPLPVISNGRFDTPWAQNGRVFDLSGVATLGVWEGSCRVCCKLFIHFADNEWVDFLPTVIATLMFGNAAGDSSGSRISPFIKQNLPL